ncbi:MAG: globin [Pseudomonadales bacterium]
MSDSDTITQAMELVAERAGDITEAVFARYFDRCAGSRALMDHMDEYMRGRMMTQVLLLLMEPGEQELASYLHFETDAHKSYGVEQYMYENLLAAVHEEVAQALNGAFTPAMDAAFRSRIDHLLKEIAAAAA